MRLATFSLTLFSSAFLAASFAAAQAPYVGGEHEVIVNDPYAAGVSPPGIASNAGYYAYRLPMGLGAGANRTWGYGGTCCSNVWDGYCNEQNCHQLGGCKRCKGCNGCNKPSFWSKLKCSRINIFASKSCGCQHGHCQANCGHSCSSCGAAQADEATAPAADYDPGDAGEAMPLPPQARSSRAMPLAGVSRAELDDETVVHQSWSMPRMSSAPKKSSRR